MIYLNKSHLASTASRSNSVLRVITAKKCASDAPDEISLSKGVTAQKRPRQKARNCPKRQIHKGESDDDPLSFLPEIPAGHAEVSSACNNCGHCFSRFCKLGANIPTLCASCEYHPSSGLVNKRSAASAEAETLSEIAQLAAEGKSPQLIATLLTQGQFKTRRVQGAWTDRQVRTILRRLGLNDPQGAV